MHIDRGDINVDIARPAAKVQNFVQADGHHLPFRDNSFDKVYSFDVIEHVESPQKLVTEIFRVLKSGESIEITTPNPWHWRKILRVLRGKKIFLSDTAHISTWTPAEIENLLINVGFKDIVIEFLTLRIIRIYGSHPKLDGIVEKLIPKPLGMQEIRVQAKKCGK
jgi:SAM-dependent methyltransferase